MIKYEKVKLSELDNYKDCEIVKLTPSADDSIGVAMIKYDTNKQPKNVSNDAKEQLLKRVVNDLENKK